MIHLSLAAPVAAAGLRPLISYFLRRTLFQSDTDRRKAARWGSVLAVAFVLAVFPSAFLRAQADPAASIAEARAAVRTAYLEDDLAGASLWLDSLLRLEDDRRVALVWDERWMFYYWLGLYGNLFDEAIHFDARARDALAQKIQPPADSLFETVDRGLVDQRFQVYEQLRQAMLSEEERAFAVLQFDYLLRLDAANGAWNQRADAFLTRYPKSRFANYLRYIRPSEPKTGPGAIRLDLSLFNGTWRDELERSLRPLWGADFAVGFWYRRWTTGLRMTVGSAKLDRDVEEDGFIWPKEDPSVFFGLDLETGYDVVHTPKFRLAPVVAGGFGILSPPGSDEEEDPLPDYYENFRFFTGTFSGALQADITVGELHNDEHFGPQSNHGLRLRAGYRWLYFGRQNPMLPGDMIFVSAGYQLFGRLLAK